MNKLVQARYGPMYISTLDRCIHRSLDLYGEWAELELNPICKLLKPTDLVLDVGANIGTHTVAMAKWARQVIAFEPQPPTFQMLCANVVVNDLHNVQTLQFALGEKEQNAWMDVIEWTAPDNNHGGAKVYTEASPERAPVHMLCIDQLRLPACDFIKMDIEGGEVAAVFGGRETISRYKPLMYLEMHEKAEAELLDLVKSLGYRAYDHPTTPFNPNNWNDLTTNIFGEYVERNILCVPAGRELETNLRQL